MGRSLPLCYCDVVGYKIVSLGRVVARYMGRRIIKALPPLKKIERERKREKEKRPMAV